MTVTPGLRWRTRNGRRDAYWICRPAKLYRKFKPRTVRLWSGLGEPTPAEMEQIAAECQRMQEQMYYATKHPKAKGPPPVLRARGYVYFIEGANKIKIGFALDPQRRLQRLQIGSPVSLSLIGLVRGTPRTERQLHMKFRHTRAHGEWFHRSPALLEYIAEFALLEEQTNRAQNGGNGWENG